MLETLSQRVVYPISKNLSSTKTRKVYSVVECCLIPHSQTNVLLCALNVTLHPCHPTGARSLVFFDHFLFVSGATFDGGEALYRIDLNSPTDASVMLVGSAYNALFYPSMGQVRRQEWLPQARSLQTPPAICILRNPRCTAESLTSSVKTHFCICADSPRAF